MCLSCPLHQWINQVEYKLKKSKRTDLHESVHSVIDTVFKLVDIEKESDAREGHKPSDSAFIYVTPRQGDKGSEFLTCEMMIRCYVLNKVKSAYEHHCKRLTVSDIPYAAAEILFTDGVITASMRLNREFCLHFSLKIDDKKFIAAHKTF